MSDVNVTEKDQYGRAKGAPWFPLLFKKDIMLLGQGGIGSWVGFLLARIGVNLYTFDHDTYEAHNMTGQMVRTQDVGKKKTAAMKDIINEFSPDCLIETNDKYLKSSMTNNIVICGFDNMEARKISFENWKAGIDPENPHDYFFQDGRLNVEQYQIFNICGNRPDLIKFYETQYLFDDSKVPEAECTFKQTSHSAAMIAGHMVGFLTNWAFNVSKKSSIRTVPFKHEYVTAVNLTTNDGRL